MTIKIGFDLLYRWYLQKIRNLTCENVLYKTEDRSIECKQFTSLIDAHCSVYSPCHGSNIPSPLVPSPSLFIDSSATEDNIGKAGRYSYRCGHCGDFICECGISQFVSSFRMLYRHSDKEKNTKNKETESTQLGYQLVLLKMRKISFFLQYFLLR